MVIGKNTVKRIMKSVTQRPVSDNAVYIMVDKVEESIKEITVKAEQLLIGENKVRKIQGMREKRRISKEEIVKAWQ